MNSEIYYRQKRVPHYVLETVKRLSPVFFEHKDWVGYTFRLYSKWPRAYEDSFKKELDKLLKWCQKNGAYTETVAFQFWFKQWEDEKLDYLTQYNRAVRLKFHNYADVIISDPVAVFLEELIKYKALGAI